jgi:hypothetical protein
LNKSENKLPLTKGKEAGFLFEDLGGDLARPLRCV